MSTGVAELDGHHQEIILRLNQLHEMMQEGRGRGELRSLLDYLLEYTASHFAKEEACMEKYGCPAAAGNIKTHAALVERVKGFRGGWR